LKLHKKVKRIYHIAL